MKKHFVNLLICSLLAACIKADLPNTVSIFEYKSIESSMTLEKVIRENLPDSMKVYKMWKLMEEIDRDTSLVMQENSDSLGNSLWAFFRNDSLVKIMSGSPSIYISGSSTYYLFNGELIALLYRCSKIQNTGMCNPVSASSLFYFYQDSVIEESHQNHIGSYIHCGCDDLSQDSPFNQRDKYLKSIDIVGLKRSIKASSPTPKKKILRKFYN